MYQPCMADKIRVNPSENGHIRPYTSNPPVGGHVRGKPQLNQPNKPNKLNQPNNPNKLKNGLS